MSISSSEDTKSKIVAVLDKYTLWEKIETADAILSVLEAEAYQEVGAICHILKEDQYSAVECCQKAICILRDMEVLIKACRMEDRDSPF
ncbi:hypothetical protein WDZ92_28260 [Nostoc sp. NIES-2111]